VGDGEVMAKRSNKDVQGFRGVFAAGGVVIDSLGRVAVIHRPRYDDWSLPKGKLERGEDVLVAAVREVWEEACCLATPQAFVGSICYHVKGRPKWVFFWRMEVHEVQTFRPCEEVDRLEWLKPAAAMRRLMHKGERAMLARAMRTPVAARR
jgi:8-oxo-dGTP diphosphatase